MNTKIWIDADGCPVVKIAVDMATRYQVPVVIVCDTAHNFEKEKRDGVEVITVSQGSDSADYALVNRIQPGDIAVTQDYGLAAMCLSRRAYVLNQDGRAYNEDTIDAMLYSRYTAQKIRKSGGHVKGPKKRTAKQNRNFTFALETYLSSTCGR